MTACTRIVPLKKTPNCFKDTSTKNSFEFVNVADGIVTIAPTSNEDIYTMSEIAKHAFNPSSNFKKVIFESAGIPIDMPLNGIKFSFNDVEILVTSEKTKFKEIWEVYEERLSKNNK